MFISNKLPCEANAWMLLAQGWYSKNHQEYVDLATLCHLLKIKVLHTRTFNTLKKVLEM